MFRQGRPQAVHSKQGYSQRGFPGPLGGKIECCHDFEPLGLEPAVLQESAPKISHSYQDNRLQPVGPQMRRDHFRQLHHIVSQPASAELSQVSQIFPQLGRFHSSSLGQRLTADGLDSVALQSLEAPQILGQPIDCLPRNLRPGCPIHPSTVLDIVKDSKY